MKKPKRKFKVTKLPKVAPDTVFSYKDLGLLRKYISEQGYIYSRESSGLSAKQQRQLAREIKRARHLALLPFTQTV